MLLLLFAAAPSAVTVVTFAGGGGFSDYPAKKTKKKKQQTVLPKHADPQHPLRTAPVLMVEDDAEAPAVVVVRPVVVATTLPEVIARPLAPRLAPLDSPKARAVPATYTPPTVWTPEVDEEDEMLQAVMAYMTMEDGW